MSVCLHVWAPLKVFTWLLYLILLKELEFDGDVTAQSLVLVSVDLVLLLGHLDPHHGPRIAGARTQLLQVRSVCIVLQPSQTDTHTHKRGEKTA